MIEDLQDELQQEQPQKKEKPQRSKGAFLFLAFIVWIIYAAVIILASLPKMIRAVRESNITETVANMEDIRMAAETRYARLCFAIPKQDGSASFVVCTQRIKKTGASEYHDVIEGLLSGPQSEALSIGAITYIAKGTSLIGLTVSEGTAFVNLSESFMEHPFRYSFHPVPSTEQGGYFINTISMGFAVNKNSKNLAMANEFMRFLVSTGEMNRICQAKRMVTPCVDMTLDAVYAAFNRVDASRVINLSELGLADVTDYQVRKAGWQVSNGLMTVDEAVAAFGTLQ